MGPAKRAPPGKMPQDKGNLPQGSQVYVTSTDATTTTTTTTTTAATTFTATTTVPVLFSPSPMPPFPLAAVVSPSSPGAAFVFPSLFPHPTSEEEWLCLLRMTTLLSTEGLTAGGPGPLLAYMASHGRRGHTEATSKYDIQGRSGW